MGVSSLLGRWVHVSVLMLFGVIQGTSWYEFGFAMPWPCGMSSSLLHRSVQNSVGTVLLNPACPLRYRLANENYGIKESYPDILSQSRKLRRDREREREREREMGWLGNITMVMMIGGWSIQQCTQQTWGAGWCPPILTMAPPSSSTSQTFFLFCSFLWWCHLALAENHHNLHVLFDLYTADWSHRHPLALASKVMLFYCLEIEYVLGASKML